MGKERKNNIMIDVVAVAILLVSAIKIVSDYNKKRIKTTTLFFYQIVFLVCLFSVFNENLIRSVSNFLGFEVASNFILLILVIVGLWANYLNQTRLRDLEMQIVRMARFIAINGQRIEK